MTEITIDGLDGDELTRAKNIKRHFVVEYEEEHGQRPDEETRQAMEDFAVEDVVLSRETDDTRPRMVDR